MTTFDDREKGFEKKFALDQDLKFRAAMGDLLTKAVADIEASR